ncbi:uncharacterized protein FIBRA_05689 [Fibroporia radiculosa]|uniref:MSP domain-containing protein n=1 Tax=Fibroporia radiculosa TaxID=599839 RepID=J4G9Y0_9APHY|nr:uncharacterized protein FIBRA_05689 [Fibroporia radiculosa]CCM03553.1 predicted protein [Fibroporia radiculosa]
MSLAIHPDKVLEFRRPLTKCTKRSLSITNHNDQPVAFKIKTTVPKLYRIRPNVGKIEPGETVEVQVMMLAREFDPPFNDECQDKFLIQSVIVTTDKDPSPSDSVVRISAVVSTTPYLRDSGMTEVATSISTNFESRIFLQKRL